MDVVDISLASYFWAMALVLGLMGLLAVALRWVQGRMGLRRPLGLAGQRYLSVLEVLPLDMGHRLVLVRCSGRGYLMLMGRNRDSVVVGRDLPLSQDDSGSITSPATDSVTGSSS